MLWPVDCSVAIARTVQLIGGDRSRHQKTSEKRSQHSAYWRCGTLPTAPPCFKQKPPHQAAHDGRRNGAKQDGTEGTSTASMGPRRWEPRKQAGSRSYFVLHPASMGPRRWEPRKLAMGA